MLSATNTYTGGTIVNAPGTLVLSGNNTVSPTAGSLTINNTTLQLQANAGNTSAGISSAVGYATGSSAGNASPGLSVGTTGTTFQLRSDSAVTFAGTSGIAGLSGKTVTINVGNSGAGTNNALTFSPNGNVFGGTNTFNITGSNGYSLILGAFNSNNTGGTQTFNPTTASVSIAGIGSNKRYWHTTDYRVVRHGSRQYDGCHREERHQRLCRDQGWCEHMDTNRHQHLHR